MNLFNASDKRKLIEHKAAGLPDRLHRPGWLGWQFHRRLEPRQDFSDATLELWIASFNFRLGIVVNLNVRIHTVAFNDPVPVFISQTRTRNENRSAID